MRVAIKTPKGESDKPISFWMLVGSFVGIVSLVGTIATWSINMMIFRSQAETEKTLRKEISDSVADIRKNTWPQFYTKDEINARRVELDRRDAETKATLVSIQQTIHDMELRLHDVDRKGTR